MRFSLADMIRRTRNPRRRQIPIRDIAAPAVLATNLYHAAYRPIVQAWERAVPRLVATYELSLAQMTTDSPSDLGADIGATESEVSRIFLEITPRLREWILRVERFHRTRWRGAVLSASGVDLQTMMGPEDARDTLEAVLQRNVALVKDISSETQRRMSDAVFRGLTNRTPAREVAKQLREAVDLGRARSIRIAADQLTKATSALDTERMRQAGIEKWKWRHSGKLRPREEHKARDGKLYTFDEPPSDMPGELRYCGCRKQAVVEFD